MEAIDGFVKKQKDGAKFVITSPMLRVTPEQFDALARVWLANGGPGFKVVGVPHRTVVDGEFFITRVTVIKTA